MNLPMRDEVPCFGQRQVWGCTKMATWRMTNPHLMLHFCDDCKELPRIKSLAVRAVWQELSRREDKPVVSVDEIMAAREAKSWEERARTQWRWYYGAIADSDAEIECEFCGALVGGTSPRAVIECCECFVERRRSGLLCSDRVVCLDCALDEMHGIPVTEDTHPDGFTCAECGEVK